MTARLSLNTSVTERPLEWQVTDDVWKFESETCHRFSFSGLPGRSDHFTALAGTQRAFARPIALMSGVNINTQFSTVRVDIALNVPKVLILTTYWVDHCM